MPATARAGVPKAITPGCPFGTDLNVGRIATQAIALGLPAAPISSFAVGPGAEDQALRISLGRSASRAQLMRELWRLKALVRGAKLGNPALV